MESILTDAIIQCMDNENQAGMKACFQAKPDFNVLLQHIHQTKNYQMLQYVCPFIKGSWSVSRKVSMPICMHLACCQDESSQELLKEFMRRVDLYRPQLFFHLGKAGIAWDKIATSDGYERSYFLGVVHSKSLHLFEQFATLFEPYKDYIKRYAGKHQIVAALNYFGYDCASLTLYCASFVKKLADFRRCFSKAFRDEYCTKTKELFAFFVEQQAEYLPLANLFLNKFFNEQLEHRELCLYLISIGARFGEGSLLDIHLGENRHQLYPYYFNEDV